MHRHYLGFNSIGWPILGQLAVMCGCVLLFGSGAAAEPVSISGSGTVSSVEVPVFKLLTGFDAAEGDPFSFGIRYNSVSPDQDASSVSGSFVLSGGSFDLSFPNGTVSVPGLLYGTTGVVSAMFDDTFVTLRSSAQSGMVLDLLAIDVEGDDNWRSTDAWPTDLVATLRLAPRLEVGIRELAHNGLIEVGPVEKLAGKPEPSPVPEPSTLLLIGTGVLGWVARGKAPLGI